jgi:hypothetical protein
MISNNGNMKANTKMELRDMMNTPSVPELKAGCILVSQ